MFLKHIRAAVVGLFLFTIITGVLYPFAVTGLVHILFPAKASGSLIIKDSKVVGSELIEQLFNNPKYFWSRISATSPFSYNAASSLGSNFGLLNPALLSTAQERINKLHAADPFNIQPIPVDLVTSSGSGLDPHISIAAA